MVRLVTYINPYSDLVGKRRGAVAQKNSKHSDELLALAKTFEPNDKVIIYGEKGIVTGVNGHSVLVSIGGKASQKYNPKIIERDT